MEMAKYFNAVWQKKRNKYDFSDNKFDFELNYGREYTVLEKLKHHF